MQLLSLACMTVVVLCVVHLTVIARWHDGSEAGQVITSASGCALLARAWLHVSSRPSPVTSDLAPSRRSLKVDFRRHVLPAMIIVVLGALPAAAQNQAWIRQFGESHNGESANAAAPDASGGVYVGGVTGGSLWGPQSGAGDAFLARYDHAGNRLWIRQLGTSFWDVVYAASPDDSGGVYVGGITDGSLGGPNAGSYSHDAWLARYDSSGNQLWIRQMGTSAADYLQGATPDGSGGVYVGGHTYGSLGGTSMGFWDAWLARFDKAGSLIWLRQFGTSTSEYANSITSDLSGGVYLTGMTFGDFGGFNAGSTDAWLGRFDGAGNQLWIRQLGTSVEDLANAAAPDGSGGVYVTGWSGGSLGGSQVGVGDAWVARYDGAGNQLWVRQFGTSVFEEANAAAADGYGGVYLSGRTGGGLGGANAGKWDAWLARYDSAGNPIWFDQLGTSADDLAYGAAIDGSGGVYVTGVTSGELAGPNAPGLADAWLARYDGPCVGSKYCLAKVNSAGCVPEIAASGVASASAGSGFRLSTKNVLDKKFGIYFYSKSGPTQVPFQGGVLCAQPPLVRTALQSSGGTPPCGGSFQIDFNAYVASGKDPGLVAGQQVWIQTWSRDPGFAPPDNTSLSDALSFTICP
jgi:catechol 2,3-dioxygenase-like lactoylglutathione lyase family enzyme